MKKDKKEDKKKEVQILKEFPGRILHNNVKWNFSRKLVGGKKAEYKRENSSGRDEYIQVSLETASKEIC